MLVLTDSVPLPSCVENLGGSMSARKYWGYRETVAAFVLAIVFVGLITGLVIMVPLWVLLVAVGTFIALILVVWSIETIATWYYQGRGKK